MHISILEMKPIMVAFIKERELLYFRVTEFQELSGVAQKSHCDEWG